MKKALRVILLLILLNSSIARLINIFKCYMKCYREVCYER
nr:MAG TPA: hypothetical protein [Bacteriophage sp.]